MPRPSGPSSTVAPSSVRNPRALAVLSAVLVFFFVSGACGLLYQVVWTRKLVLLLGTASYAVSTVLSIFFMGLGLGSLWGGRLADRSRSPLRLYGFFEIGIGIWALLFILLIDRGEGVVVSLLQAFQAGRAGAVALRAVLSLAFLIVPVTLMGATLPLLARFVTAQAQVRGARIGALYTVNTLGAVCGCAVTGFYLLAEQGYTRTTLVGAAANVAVGVLALVLAAVTSRGHAEPATAAARDEAVFTESEAPRAYVRGLLLVAYAISGFCALALEVLWTRLLGIMFFGTTYAFTTMLTTLLCGIAVGSAVASVLVDRSRHRMSLLGWVEAAIGVACLLMLLGFVALPEKYEAARFAVGSNWHKLVWIKFRLSFLVLFLPMFLFGMTFPIIVKAFSVGRGKVGRDVGLLYGANTFGGVLGALAGGYILLPYLGTHRGIVILGSALFGTGVVLVLACPSRRKVMKVVSAAVLAGLFVVVFRAMPADVGRELGQWFVPENESVIHYREGVEGTVVVSEPKEDTTGANRVLWINAVQATASIEKGVKMNRLQGVLPLLLHPGPREALFMCFGSGITAGTLAIAGFDRIDAVEISRDVLDAAPLFSKDNFGVVENPKVNLMVDDGRNFLLTTKKHYDVITFEPMPLALAGVSTFYTQEYYQLCLDHLAPGGIVSQWVPLHSLSADLVRSLLYTFTSVFPEYCIWFVNADLFITGSNGPLVVDYAVARERIAQEPLHAALEEVGLDEASELLACFFMGKDTVERYVQGGAIMSDDRPWAEFVAPKLMYERNVGPALAELRPFYEEEMPVLSLAGVAEGERPAVAEELQRRRRAHAIDLEGVYRYYESGPLANPEELFKRALGVDPGDANARYYLKEVAQARVGQLLGWDETDPEEFYRDQDIETVVGEVVALHIGSKTLCLSDEREIRADALLVATGGIPRGLDLPGESLENVFKLRNLKDSRVLRSRAAKAKTVVVVGASFIGMETAASLRELDLNVIVVAPEEIPFAEILGPRVGEYLLNLHRKKGVAFRLGRSVEEFVGGSSLESVLLDDGSELEADLAVIGVGVSPATHFLHGVDLLEDNSLETDERLSIGDGVFAAGDIATYPAVHLGGRKTRITHWRLAMQHGRTAARNMLGQKRDFEGVPFFWTRQFGVSIGCTGYLDEWDTTTLKGNLETGDFVVIFADKGHLVGAAGTRSKVLCRFGELMRLGQLPPPETVQESGSPYLEGLFNSD